MVCVQVGDLDEACDTVGGGNFRNALMPMDMNIFILEVSE